MKLIKKNLEARATGLRVFRIVVGIDMKGTSKEALDILLTIRGEKEIYYTKSHVIFHPKIYVFEGDAKSRIIIGSSNLTTPGLFQNAEASTVFEFEMTDVDGLDLLYATGQYMDKFRHGMSQNSHNLSKRLIKLLLKSKLVETEHQRKRKHDSKPGAVDHSNDEINNRINELFPTVAIRRLPSIPSGSERLDEPIPRTEIYGTANRGGLVWKRRLSSSDAQSVQNGTHITGQLRFSQADWKSNGASIDRTKYFRYDIFGNQNWVREPQDSEKEVANVLFHVKILGQDIGFHTLEIVHNPPWEAGQANVTTMLRWGHLMDTIRSQNLTGRDLYLYKSDGEGDEVFFIEIM